MERPLCADTARAQRHQEKTLIYAATTAYQAGYITGRLVLLAIIVSIGIAVFRRMSNKD